MSYLREYLPEKILSYETTQQGGRRERARIRNDSQEGKN